MMELAPGTTFGRYVIIREIGHGGMATVYEAEHEDLAKRVALKVLHRWLSLRPDIVRRFVLEARTASRIRHAHVVAISDIGVEQEAPFMAMELLEGVELAEVAHAEGALDPARVADIMLPVISAVAAAHDAGILHRDLKTENIFLAQRPPFGEHPMLLDFGISKMKDAARPDGLTATDEILGTPEFMAPEVAQHGMDRIDARADQYALGVILYRLLAGVLPYVAESPYEVMNLVVRGGARPPSRHGVPVPPALDELVMRAMHPDREARYASVRALGTALLPFASARAHTLWAAEFDAAPAARAGSSSAPRAPSARPAAPEPARPRAPRGEDLRVVPCLADLAEVELGRVIEGAEIVELDAGALLFEDGDDAEKMFVVLAGSVDLTTAEGIVERVEAGAIVGATAMIEGELHGATATAAVRARLLALSHAALTSLSTSAPAAAVRLLDHVAISAVRRLRAVARVAAGGGGPDRELALLRAKAAIREWALLLDES